MKLYASMNCGCCTAELEFSSEARAEAAFQKAGLGSNITIVDDNGDGFDGIDTFYGFSTSESDSSDRGLGYLAKRISDIFSSEK